MTDAEYDYLFRDADPRWQAYYRMRREEYHKKHPLTNFEKWRDSLTPENFQTFTLEVLKRVFPGSKLTTPKEASEKFLRWADAPAKEEEE